MRNVTRRKYETMNPDISRAVWRKSARSGGTTNCVEVAGNLPGVVGIRDSKNPDGPALAFTRAEWRTFVGNVKNGEFDQQ